MKADTTQHTALSPGQLALLLSKTIPARLPVLISGAPGVGKTDIVHQAARECGARVLVSHPVVSDPTDYKGVPVLAEDKQSAVWAPYGDLLQLLEGHCDSLTVAFLDDLGQAPASVQAAAMQLILARRVNDHRVSDNVVFVAATNRREDRAAVSGLLEPLKSRFCSIVELTPRLDDWCDWAARNDVPPEMIAFVRFRPDMLTGFSASADLVNSPTPRTLANCGRTMALGLPREMEYPVFAGAIGAGAASELIAYLDIYRTLPDVDKLLADPVRAELPDVEDSPAIAYALCGAVAYRATLENFGAIVQLADRLPVEFAVTMITDCVRRTVPKGGGDSPLGKTKEWNDWVRKNEDVFSAG